MTDPACAAGAVTSALTLLVLSMPLPLPPPPVTAELRSSLRCLSSWWSSPQAKQFSAIAAHLTPRGCSPTAARRRKDGASSSTTTTSISSSTTLLHPPQGCSPPGLLSSQLAYPAHVAVGSVADQVARDAEASSTWRLYSLKQHAHKMIAAKDRGLPMSAAARSTRHMALHSKRLVPPVKPKPSVAAKAKRKDVEGGLHAALLADDGGPKSVWQWLMNAWDEFRQAVSAILNGLLQQELEVQMFAAFLIVSALVSLWAEIERALVTGRYEAGHAPPAPPSHPDWTVTVTDSAMGFALSSPVSYLLVDFGTATLLGVLYFFWEDVKVRSGAQGKIRELLPPP